MIRKANNHCILTFAPRTKQSRQAEFCSPDGFAGDMGKLSGERQPRQSSPPRNGSRLLSLMPALRVNSGTANKKTARRRSLVGDYLIEA